MPIFFFLFLIILLFLCFVKNLFFVKKEIKGFYFEIYGCVLHYVYCIIILRNHCHHNNYNNFIIILLNCIIISKLYVEFLNSLNSLEVIFFGTYIILHFRSTIRIRFIVVKKKDLILCLCIT